MGEDGKAVPETAGPEVRGRVKLDGLEGLGVNEIVDGLAKLQQTGEDGKAVPETAGPEVGGQGSWQQFGGVGG
jgi:hypothetical protein